MNFWLKRIVALVWAIIMGLLATMWYDKSTGFLAALVLYCYIDTYADLLYLRKHIEEKW